MPTITPVNKCIRRIIGLEVKWSEIRATSSGSIKAAFTKRKIFCRKFSSVYPCRLFCFSNTQLRSLLRDKDILKFAGECIYYAKNSDAIRGNEKTKNPANTKLLITSILTSTLLNITYMISHLSSATVLEKERR